MKRIIFGIALLLLCSAHSRAALWETEDAVTARYGQPVKVDPSQHGNVRKRTYRYNGMDVSVTFLDGQSQYEEFTPVTGDKSITALLGINAGKYYWKEDAHHVQSKPINAGNVAVPEQPRIWNLGTIDSSVGKAIYQTSRMVFATNEFLEYMADARNR